MKVIAQERDDFGCAWRMSTVKNKMGTGNQSTDNRFTKSSWRDYCAADGVVAQWSFGKRDKVTEMKEKCSRVKLEIIIMSVLFIRPILLFLHSWNECEMQGSWKTTANCSL